MGIDNYIYLVETVEKRGHRKVLGVGVERCARQQNRRAAQAPAPLIWPLTADCQQRHVFLGPL